MSIYDFTVLDNQRNEVSLSDYNRESKYEQLRLENQLCFSLYAASREVIKQYRPFLSELDFTYTQYVAMMVFWQEKEINVKDLGKKLYLDSGTLTPVLKSLEAKSYVHRQRSLQDERILIVAITPKGEALKKKASEIPQKISSCVPLSSDEAIQLYQLLYKILEE